MNSGLYTTSDVSITRYTNIISSLVTDKITNTLLSGETHIQTIGDPRYIAEVELIADKIQKATIDKAVAVGEPLKASDGSNFWIGISTDDQLSWDEIIPGKGFYKTKLKLEVQETSEGVIE